MDNPIITNHSSGITELRLSDGSFDLKTWRSFLNEISKSITYSRCQVICPFGFEVSRKPEYLKRGIRNFFIYLGIDSSEEIASQDCLSDFYLTFLCQLKIKFPYFYQSILQIFCENNRHIINTNGDFSIYIKCRNVKSDLLEEYSHYLLATIGGVIQNEVKAKIEFDNDLLSRRYLFQLCIIQSYIFFDEVCSITKDHKFLLLNRIKQLHRAEHIELDRASAKALLEDTKLLRDVVWPYFKLLYDHVKEKNTPHDNITCIRVKDYHGYNMLNTNISHHMLFQKSKYIIDSYTNFA